MDIEVPTVYGASKFEQKASDAPSSITVLTSEDIKRYGYRTLADVLQSVQGFQVSYDRNYAFLGSRGVNLGDFNARVLLLVDGHRINNNLTDGAYIDTAFVLDIDLIDRIEIIRGPGSVLYGNNAFFGVINVITRQGRQVNGAEASVEYGEFDTYKLRASYGRLFTNGLEMLFSGSYYNSEGAPHLFYQQFDSPSQNNGFADYLDADTFTSFFSSIAFHDFSIEGAYNRREKDNPTAQFVGGIGGFDQSGLTTVDERKYVAGKYNHSFPDIFDLTAQLYYDASDFELGYPTAFGVLHEKDAGEWWGTEVQLTKHLWEKHIFTVGAEVRDDFHQQYRLFNADGSLNSTTSKTRESFGVYFQGDVEVHTNLHVNGGIRFDKYTGFDASFSPRVALIYTPFKTSTFKAIYGTAFRTPNFLELALSSSLNPENITSYELVYEQELVRYLRSSLSLFYNEMDDLIVFENGGFNNFDANTRGTELALEGNWPMGIRGRASYTFQQTDRADGLNQPDSPEHLLKFNLSVPVYKEKIFAGLEFQYTSRRDTVFSTLAATTQPGSAAADFGVVNFTLFSRNLIKDLEWSASIYNILDTRYDDPATRFHLQDRIEQNGRTFRLKVTYHF